MEREFVEPDWTRLPGYRDVSREQWESAQWQRAHTVKNLKELKTALGTHLTDELAGTLKLSDEERNTMLASGHQAIFRNRVGWANTYLKKAGLLAAVKRGWVKITSDGRAVLAFERIDRFQVTKTVLAKRSGQHPQRPWKAGWRFSTKAFIPSRWSSVPKRTANA